MRILSGKGDYDKTDAKLKVYLYFKDDTKMLSGVLQPEIAKQVIPELKNAANGIRFLSGEGVWHSFLKLGERKKATAESFRKTGAGVIKDAEAVHAKKVVVIIPSSVNVSMDESAAALTEGIVLGKYNYTELKTSEDVADRDGDKTEPIVSVYAMNRGKISRNVLDRANVVAGATNEARYLADAPGNMMTPGIFAGIIAKKAKEEGIHIKILNKETLRKMGWNAFLGVARGSDEPAKVLILEYRGANKSDKYVVVGKGITFDSGGISIKPSHGMEEMKCDMAGAAAAAMIVILASRLNLSINLNAVIPLTENMPDGRAQKPGDVVKTLSGKTVEIISTDAEGRMILADALSYAAGAYKPKFIVDLATLTGACVVALGSEASGIMGNNDALVKKLIKAGEASSDRLWELPLWDEYKELLKSEIADIKNAGSRSAGTIQGGLFLKEFVGDTNWAHIDIAGTAYLNKPGAYFRKGATGAGVRLLVKFFESV